MKYQVGKRYKIVNKINVLGDINPNQRSAYHDKVDSKGCFTVDRLNEQGDAIILSEDKDGNTLTGMFTLDELNSGDIKEHA